MSTSPIPGALSKEQRDALPSEMFAISARRLLPIHDAAHIKLSWGTVERALASDSEKSEARRKILHAAKTTGVDTSKWHLNAMSFNAMSLDFPETPDHPNKLPFTGILTRLDQPSDRALGGTGGKRVILPKEVAEEALGSLLGMAVDFTPDFDGHDPKRKIGLITAAEVVGDAIEIAGFFYAADFPDEVQQIQADKNDLGFSFEAQSYMQSMKADPLVVVACEFTGAAVLYKNKAAYQTTSIAANADQEILMDKEVKEAFDSIATGMKALSEGLAAVTASVAEAAKKPVTAASIAPMVMTHCAALRQCASQLAAAGIGMHSSAGHVAVLNKMADTMEAEAAMGRIPHVYRDHDFMSAYGSADKDVAATLKASAEEQRKATEVLLKPLVDGLAAMKTMVTDLGAKVATTASASTEASRKTLNPGVTAALARLGITASEEGGKIKVADFDAAAKKSGLPREQSMSMKLSLRESGILEGNA